MNRQISSEETKKLFQFCDQHYVYHYDLQIEIVDHLASSIEEQWKNNSNISFEEALKFSFKKFGITGFSAIKRQKEKSLNKKYNLLLWKYLVDFFTWPKFMLTLVGIILLYQFFNLLNHNIIIFYYFSFTIIFLLLYYFTIFPKKFKIKTRGEKSFLLLKKLKDVQYASFFITQLPLFGLSFWDSTNITWPNYWLKKLLLVSFIIIFTLLLYGNFFYIPQKVKQHFFEQFGEYVV